jgi:hypothetical protein
MSDSDGWAGEMFRRFCSVQELSDGLVPARPLDRFVQFPLGRAQMLLGLRPVAVHVVVIGRTRALHLVNRLDNVVMDCHDVVPVANTVRESCAGKEGKTDSTG